MKKYILILLSTTSFFLNLSSAKATTINFDDFTTDVRHVNFIPESENSYAGVTWYVDKQTNSRAQWSIVSNQYITGGINVANSGNYVAHITYGAPIFGIIFPEAVNFTSAYFMNYYGTSNGVVAIGYRNGVKVSQSTEINFSNTTDWMEISTPLTNVDRVEFFVHQNSSSSRADILIDDVSFTPILSSVPEPAKIYLLGFGLGCLCIMRRRLLVKNSLNN